MYCVEELVKVVLQEVYSQVCESFSDDVDEDGNAIAYSSKDILKKIKAVVYTIPMLT